MTDPFLIQADQLAPWEERAWWLDHAGQGRELARGVAEWAAEALERRSGLEHHLEDLGLAPETARWVGQLIGTLDVSAAAQEMARALAEMVELGQA